MAMEWTRVWEADNYPLRVESAPSRDAQGHTWTQWRFAVGDTPYAGAVAVPVCPATGRVLLVHQDRVRIDRALWELPRGMAELSDSDPVETALRELHEETGVRASEGEFLGFIYPDSGLFAAQVGVVRIEIPSEAEGVDPRDGEVNDERWVSPTELRDLILSGELRDALSLSALLLAGCLPAS